MDPTGLQSLPSREFRKRRAYWLKWREITYGPSEEGSTVRRHPRASTVTVEEGWKPEDGATVIGE